MVANEKISPWGTEAKFLKIESRNLSQSKKKKKKKWPVLIYSNLTLIGLNRI